MAHEGYSAVRRSYAERAAAAFKVRSSGFRSVDEKTQAFRQGHLDLGFVAVFSEDVPERDTLAIIHSPEMMEILNSGDW